MKRLLLIIVSILGLCSCGNKTSDIKTTSISLNETSLNMYEGEKGVLVASVNPDNAKDKSVIWSSSDSSVVSVDNNGNISALKKGNCNITAKTNDTGLVATCSINVNEYVKCESYVFQKNEYKMDLYDELQLNITYTPENTSYKKLNYVIEDPTIISIDENGYVKALKEGKTEVRVSHIDNTLRRALNFIVREPIETGLFIGEKPVKYRGTQYDTSYGNYSYTYETNTLVIDKTIITDRDLVLKEYENISVAEMKETDTVSFMLSYEGTRPLNIEFIGDVKINVLEAEGYVGYLYVKNEVNVYLNGPGLITSSSLTHSLFYGKKATFFINDLKVNMQCEGLCYGMCANAARFSDSSFNVWVNKDSDVSSKYACLYIGGGISASSSHFDLDGFNFGAYVGTSYLYDCYFSASATLLGVNFYALTTYDTEIIILSSGTGASFYDGLYMTRGSIFVKSETDFAIASTEATLLFDNAVVNALCNKGNGLQAWRIIANNSTLKAEVNNGNGLQCIFNTYVSESEKAKVWIINSDVTAEVKNEGSAIWGIGLFEIESATFNNGEKYLFDDILIKGRVEDQIFAICDKTATELEYEEVEGGYVVTNGVKSLTITRSL